MRGLPRLAVEVTREASRVAQAQELRYRVLVGKGARAGARDEDRFDGHCDHLVVRERSSGRAIGTCRVLPPEAARRAGGYCNEQLFELGMLDVLRDRMVEVGRACVDPAYRGAAVLPQMWSTLARYLIDNGHDYVLASAGVGLEDGGDAAASLYRIARENHMSPEDYRVFPRCSLPLENLRETLAAAPPPLLRGYLGLGAWVCGEPAWDPVLDCADFPVLLPLARMHSRPVKEFLGQAA